MTQGDEEEVARLTAYLEQHHRQVNLAALRKQLIQSGHPPALVDLAVRRVEGAAGVPKMPAWPAGLGILVGNLALLGFALGVGNSLSLRFPALTWLPLVVVLILVAAELGLGLRLRGGTQDDLGRALVWGFGFTAGLVGVAAVLFGICVVIILGFYGAGP